ncbi:bactofilin family protein [Pontixanthobacter aquaemixtae]|uniref:Polymer-forming cytoskeletal protein n=1 Tax=Pontixanthobacter aquaemixtae TaxID=1958940 RepID=A0A844ZX94_9SPHN|nr:polymer-forming cytoskeletal protein [Pontixanthobacter aquaemixtae]MXO91377.1 polymer-forming cytoskeletal protein [Pontixanthobacter aquaemixtae]
MASNNSTFSVIGSDVTIKGDVTASTELHVDGAIEGDISCSSLVQGEGSRIEGAIKAESARLAGTLTGSIAARELVILKSAEIHGDVQYDALTIEQGAQVEGRFAPQGAQAAAAPQKNSEAAKSSNEDEPKLIISN